MAVKNPAERRFGEHANPGRTRRRAWSKRLKRCFWPIGPMHLLLALLALYFLVAYFELGSGA